MESIGAHQAEVTPIHDESLFRKVFDHSNDAILVIDPSRDKILDLNPTACQRLGYARARLLALRLSELFPQQLERLTEFARLVSLNGHGALEDFICRTQDGSPLPIDLSGSVIELAGQPYLLLLLHELSQRNALDHILRTIVEGTAALTGEAFFHALVRNLAQAMNVSYAYVSEFTTVKTRVRTIAYWGPAGLHDNIEYDLANTPCQSVLRGEIRHYPQGVCTLFPEDKGLMRLGADGFLAIPLVDPTGNVLGHMAVFDTKPMPRTPTDMSIFRIFAARATAELLRQQAEHQRQTAELALRESEQRLATILASAMDAVIVFDAAHHITLFNVAAEKMFHCSADWAKGQPFERFLSKPFRVLLERFLQTLASGARSGARAQQLWLPEGVTALRADGEEFPIEGTLSAVPTDGKPFYTVILRDVNERERAEQALKRLNLENRYLQEQLSAGHRFEDIISNAAAMQPVFEAIQKVAGAGSTVLLNGETGTGKELLARAIHNLSPRKDKLLVKMNCAALPAELIESELFGHEKGAFTGATIQRKGRFELADGGSLFLDEVGELTLPAQAKLLRVLQEQEFERVGGTRPIKVDARVIAATNRDLAAMVKNGEFRADLYYRLNVFPLRVPPLRERKEDIPVLARHFLRVLERKLGKTLQDFSPRALQRLQNYPWPGNVRELQNIVERAAILAAGPIIEVKDALELRPEAGAAAEAALSSETLEEVERAHITQVLKNTAWVIEGAQGAAAILGLNPSTLRSRMQKLGIQRPRAL